jgi:hypothetical protein
MRRSEPILPLILDSDTFPEPLVLDGSPDMETPFYDFDPNLPLSQPQAESWVARLSPAERLDVLVRIARAAPTQLHRAEGWSHYFAASRLDRHGGPRCPGCLLNLNSARTPAPSPMLRRRIPGRRPPIPKTAGLVGAADGVGLRGYGVR